MVFSATNQPTNNPTVKLTPDQRASLVQEYVDGAYPADLAAKYGISDVMVYYHIKRAGIVVQKRVRPGYYRQRVLTFAQREEALTRYASGEHSGTIAKSMKVSNGTIVWLAQKAGISTERTSRRLAVNEDAFATLSADVAYWAGFLMADGCIGDGNVVISLAAVDRGHLVRFRDFLGAEQRIEEFMGGQRGRQHPQCRFNVFSRRMCADLAALGVTRRKTFTANPPDHLLRDRDFWRGMVDGDGSIGDYRGGGTKKYPRVSLCGTYEVVAGFRAWVLSMAPNVRAAVRPIGKIFDFAVPGVAAIIVLRALYDDAETALDRKATLARRLINQHDLAPPTVFRAHSQFRPRH